MLTLCQKVQLCVALVLTILGCSVFQPAIQAQELFEHRPTTGNEVDFMLSNYGILGLDVRHNRAGGKWPRSAVNPGTYLFGSGIWLGAVVEGRDGPEKRVSISYNPNSGLSWFSPGDVSDGASIVNTPEAISKYRLYFSTDYDADGQALDGNAPGWPLWNTTGTPVGSIAGNLGQYVGEVNNRNTATQGEMPVFISDQDVICRYKDTDLNLHEGGEASAISFGLQVEQALYSWNDAERENFVLVRYDLTNTSDETLNQCHFAFAGDYDIGPNSQQTFRSHGTIS